MHAADDVHRLPIERIKLDAVARECDCAKRAMDRSVSPVGHGDAETDRGCCSELQPQPQCPPFGV